jgi:hypothetical protein
LAAERRRRPRLMASVTPPSPLVIDTGNGWPTEPCQDQGLPPLRRSLAISSTASRSPRAC